jgi:hypothetical protein
MSFKTGDYVVYTEEKIKELSKLIKENKVVLSSQMYDDQMKTIDGLRGRVYIFVELMGNKEYFGAKINGKKFNGLRICHFRLANIKEKRKYNLSQIYNKRG